MKNCDSTKFQLRNVVADLPEVKKISHVNDVTVSHLEYPLPGVYSNVALDFSISKYQRARARDSESGLDYFGARFYSATQGRFTSADPLLASGEPNNPKTWNRYAYVLNNPIRLIDPNGLEEVDPVQPEEEEQKKQQEQKKEPQVVDLRADPAIVREVKKIQESAKPLAQAETPILSDVRVVLGETSTVNNGSVIDGYGNGGNIFCGGR